MRAILTIFPPPVRRRISSEGPAAEAHASPQQPSSQPLLPLPSSSATPAVSPEGAVLQRLLAELEARSVLRAPTPYIVEQLPRRSRVRGVHALVALLWVLSLALCVFVVKYVDLAHTAQSSDPAQTRSLTNLTAAIGDQNKQFARVVNSIESLAGSVASSSVHDSAVAAVLKRLGREPASGAVPLKKPELDLIKAPPPPPAPPAAMPQREAAPADRMGGHHHGQIEDVVAPRSAIVHHSDSGVMDYWLLPRMVAGSRIMTKVIPIAQTNLGLFVHGVDEVRDYIITPSGDWLNASESAAK